MERSNSEGNSNPPTSIMASKSTDQHDSQKLLSGTKSPRKVVQWLDDHLNSQRNQNMPHALDAEGKDLNPFNKLTSALERHKSEHSQHQHPSPPQEELTKERPGRVHYFPPRHNQTNLPPLETQGLSHSPKDNTATTVSSPTTSSPPTTVPSPTREVPGQFIDPHESAGLPGTDIDTYANREAAALVRAHTRRKSKKREKPEESAGSYFFGFGRSKKANAEKSAVKSRDFGNSEIDRLTGGVDAPPSHDDLERDADTASISTTHGMVPARGGVLSALLALYNNQQQDGLSSGASTPGSSVFEEPPGKPWVESRGRGFGRGGGLRSRSRSKETPDEEKDAFKEEFQKAYENAKKAARTSPINLSQSDSPETVSGSSSSPPSPPSGPQLKEKSSYSSLHLPFGLGKGARPAQARNAGGVFGSLIASTGNISGAAAPANSTIMPNVKRPGYHLSRYSYEDSKKDVRAPVADHNPSKSLDSGMPTRRRPASMMNLGMDIAEEPSSPTSDTHLVQTPVSAYIPPPPPIAREGTFDSTASGSFAGKRPKWTAVLKDLPYANSVLSLPSTPGGWKSGRSTPTPTPTPGSEGEKGEWIGDAWLAEKERKERERKERKRRKKAEIYITRHVAQIIQRQEFILKLARVMMMFGAPAHRLQSQIKATARVLEIELSCMYLPDVMLISFDDSHTGTSQVKFLRQSSALDLAKLSDAYTIYWQVIHDEISVSHASQALDELMRKPQLYNWWQSMLIGGFCSAAICSVSFAGSFIDCVAVFPLGMLLVAIQILSVRNELYSNVFEITVATLFSFLSGALASTGKICYSALASASVVLILPGFIVLSGALEVLSRNIVSGSVRMCYAVVYCLFLGFGLAMGAEAYKKITGQQVVGLSDTTCAYSHSSDVWWRSDVGPYWAFLTVPMFSLFLTMRNQQRLFRKEMPITIAIACAGWVTNHFVGRVFVNQNDVSAAVGAFAVGFVANMYGRFLKGNAFVIMITGILFQVPSGLGNNGLLVFVSQQSAGSSESYLSGFQTALQLIAVAIGLTVGLGISLFLAYPIQSRRRAGGVFSL
ncbi:pheromone-regulated protein prm10 [Paramarasmius palmivorus]|uniref:Pheromone-regulated protein prm10 n=1 Tax=Paramarasmius palmivorus TaxID=297713 RepID=A0AAW0DMV4_9AGAR